HNFVYLVAILAPLRYLWSVKIVSPQPVIYALLAAGLLTWRYKKFRQWWRAIRSSAVSRRSFINRDSFSASG
ncbi:hypothetical protein NL480_29805, partial [Klebsiella pneumoniae]|nr:hypothetical protein [Klebsiella pneumoniae]